MKRLMVLTYAVVAYATFLGVFVYWFGFLIGVGVPKSIDDPPRVGLAAAAAINLLLVTIFGLQHSIMARPSFKQWWTRFVPKPVERSTYVLAANAALALLYWKWEPMGVTIWHIENGFGRAMLYFGFAVGATTILASSFMINHFDLFGLRQAWCYFRDEPYRSLPFSKPALYRYVRHPLYAGWLLSMWCTPTMTVAHLLFAAAFTTYILTAIRLEERNLVEHHGAQYAEYRRTVPMLVPRPSLRHRGTPITSLHYRTRNF